MVAQLLREFRQLESVWWHAGRFRMHARVARGPAHEALPVVLVHGLGISSRYMVPLAVRLGRDRPVYAPDLPGFGRSQKPRRTLTIAELADALADWMQAAGLDRAALLGNSLGCQIIAELAVRHPRRVDRAVLVGPTMDPHARTAPRQIWGLFLDSFREPPSQAALVFFDYVDCGPVRLWKTFREGLNHPIEDRLPHMDCPTLVLRGARDPIVSQRWAEEAAGLLPHGRLIVLPGAPHTANYTTRQEVVRVVRPFLDEERPPAASRRTDHLTPAQPDSA